MKNRAHIFVLCFVIYSFLIEAQQYTFHNYSVKEGVAQSQVYSLLQDHRGYLWMGTRGGGLTRFDGIEFKNYTIKDGLINNYVFCIKEDSKHNLWIGTNKGISNYNGIQFKNYTLQQDSSQVWAQEICFDKEGNKWIASNLGVLLLSNKGVTNVSELLKEKRTVVNAICVDNKNDVWYGTAEGLYKIITKENKYALKKYNKTKGFVNNSITCIKEDSKGNLWVGTYGDGLYVYNGKRFSRIDLNQELYRQTVLDVYFDKNNTAWLATLNHGVAQYNLLNGTFFWLTEQEGLSNNHVRSIIQDNCGNYWFGTSGGGVCNYFGKQFTLYDKTSGLAGNFIYSIFRDSQKRLWIGTSDKGVSLLDSSKFYSFNAANIFVDAKIKTIAEDNNGTVYFGTDGQGLYKFNGQTFEPINEFNKKYIRTIVKDKDGNMWIATAGAGLFKLIMLDKNQYSIVNYTTKEGLLHNRLTSLHYDKKGRLWYGTENNGIGCVINDQIQKFVISDKNGLASNAIRCLAEDKSGYLWIGTAGDGISSMPLYQGDYKIKKYNHTNGLTSSNIYLICCDNNNNIFVGTETGLDLLHLDKSRKPIEIKHYSKGEGFSGIETCQNSVYTDEDGTIWFGTINGLIKYNPANLVRNEHEPITNISNIKLFYEPISNTKFNKHVGDWNLVNDLELPYNQNHLTFDFFAINFSNPDAVKYQWKLEGFDKDWCPVSAQHTFSYPNLSSGEYTFMVKACNEDGIWNQQPILIKFRILPPFWLRWWFIVISVLVVGGAVFLLFKKRIQIIKTKAAEEQKKTQMEKEMLELEQKALRLQMNPHFIFNALNSIQSQIGTNNEQSARYYLAKFSRLMRQILDNSQQTTITLEEEVNTLENYLLIEKFCSGDKFDYKIIIDAKIEKDFVKIPPMILQPFVENSIKHGLKHINGKRGLIEISFFENNNVLECSILDNGIGRVKASEINKNSKETYHKSTALFVTQERLDLLKEDKNIRSLEIIDLYDKNNEAEGTKVIIRIPLG